MKAGDYLVLVPTQHNVRGVRFEATLSDADLRMDVWRMGKMPVPARSIAAAADPGIRYCFPDDFRCTVRRTA